ncbi:hypothetical protein ACFPM0_24415 [Pseudonocardia sulfidoxydans]
MVVDPEHARIVACRRAGVGGSRRSVFGCERPCRSPSSPPNV